MSKKQAGDSHLYLVEKTQYHKGLDKTDVDFRDDSAQKGSDTQKMNDITREEFNAKLETIEAKMDARVESVSSKIESFMAVQAERDKRMEATVNQISANHSELKSSLGSMKTTVIVTAVSTVLAIVIGVASFNATLTSNMFSAFQAGKSEAPTHSQPVIPSPTPTAAAPASAAPPPTPTPAK
ncbi:hypothetical protein NUH87_26640 [Pseudomonas batumici]|uniref:hypothetical protein n=1 Tax=Pseudomonas batumici TaxID=226910 RepID=UPI0030D00F2F